jgi:hypothetical protein
MMKPVRDRFWGKIRLGADHECWLWMAGCSGDGYGAFWFEGRQVSAHRMAFQLRWGVILPTWVQVLHDCDNPICCNPAHLFLGTPLDNMRDKMAKGRHVSVTGDLHGLRQHPDRASRGECRWNAKLDSEQVKVIREKFEFGVTQAQIAREYGLDRRQVSKIVRRKVWRHV